MEKKVSESNLRKMTIRDSVITFAGPCQEDRKRALCQSNRARTTKYRFWNFVVLALWYEMKKFTNIYFLVTVIVQLIPSISTLEPITILGPFCFILSVALLREAVEDCIRYAKDSKINNTLARVFDAKQNQMRLKKWSDIREGDLILLIEDEQVPADMLLVNCKSSTGHAYVETSNLDGEKNLKVKQPIRNYLNNACFRQPHLEFVEVYYAPPSSDIYSFEGFCVDDGSKRALGKEHFIPRGVTMRNTEYSLGLVVFVGHETKLMLNNMHRRNKVSTTESTMNAYVSILVGFLGVLLLVMGGVSTLFSVTHSEFEDWLELERPNLFSNFFVGILSYFILLNNFLPISLIVMVEFCRLLQTLFFRFDDKLKHGTEPMMVNTISLNEELGKVQYVLSDKTGTLTKNVMKLRHFVIGCSEFAFSRPKASKEPRSAGVIEVGKDSSVRLQKSVPIPPKNLNNSKQEAPKNTEEKASKASEADSEEFPVELKTSDGRQKMLIQDQKELEFFFLLLVNTCHDCFCQSKNSKDGTLEAEVRLFGPQIMQESVCVRPKRPCLDFFSCKWLRKTKKKESMLEDVPQDSYRFTESQHYIYSQSEMLPNKRRNSQKKQKKICD